MKLSPRAIHALGTVEGVPIDNVQPAAFATLSAGGWDWLVDARIVAGYGGFNGTGALGLYSYALDTRTLSNLGSQHADVAHAFFSDANGHWLVDCGDGARDSDGHQWLDGSSDARAALGFSREGRQLFITKPDFQTLIVRDVSSDIEARFVTGAINAQTVQIERDGVLFANGGLPRALRFDGTTLTEVPAPPIPNFMRMAPQPDGSRAYAGYVGGLGLAVSWDGLAPNGYVLSGDGRDFNPDVAVRDNGIIVVASSANAGDTDLRLYEVSPLQHQWRVNGGPWRELVAVDLFEPPVTLPSVAPFPHWVWSGPYWASGPQYGYAETPGNCEVLIRADFAKLARRRPVISGTDCHATVPDAWLVGIYTGFEGALIKQAQYDDALAIARARRVPLFFYWDASEFSDEIIDRFCAAPNVIPVVMAYPAGKHLGQPLQATAAQDIARIRATVDRLTRRCPRVAISRTCYTQSGNYPWSHIADLQDGLTALVRDYRLFADLWFAWGRDPNQALANGPADLRRYVTDLADRASVGAKPPVLLTPAAPPFVPPPIHVPPPVHLPPVPVFTGDVLMLTQPTLQASYFADQVIPHPLMPGQFCIKQPNGAFVSFLSDGTLGEQPNGAFDQEALILPKAQPSSGYTLYLADRTGYPQGRVYPVLVFLR